MLAFKHAQVAAAVGSKLIHNSIDRAKSNSSQSNNLIESGERKKKCRDKEKQTHKNVFIFLNHY